MKKIIFGGTMIAGLAGLLIIAGGALLGGIAFRDRAFFTGAYVYLLPPPPILWGYDCGLPQGTLGVTCRIKGGDDILVFVSKDLGIVGMTIDNKGTIASRLARKAYKAAVDDSEPSEWSGALNTEAESIGLASEMLDGAVLRTGFVDFQGAWRGVRSVNLMGYRAAYENAMAWIRTTYPRPKYRDPGGAAQ
jgi:hypothetical protein